MQNTVLNIKELDYKYSNSDVQALDNISLKIEFNKILGLLGPNGAGKSTLLGIISGMIEKKDLDIKVSGKYKNKSLYELSTLVPQNFAFYDELTVLQNLRLFSSLSNLSKKERSELLEYAINKCKLEKKLKIRSFTLSGGQKRRLNLAIGLLKKNTNTSSR